MATAPDDELAESLVHLFREMDGLFSTVSREAGLTPQQAQLLCHAQHTRPSFTELAALLHCDKTNITGLVDRLQRRDLLTRRPDPHDRRITRVHLTPEGETLTTAFQQSVNAAVATRFTAWPAARRATLTQALTGATSALRGD
ncbi:MarR family winged helix-turn-helix transcriptional regulator [Streptomyces sp. CA-111067]|uniref:MarR family winged helix-turn-helix transcriptional regulator n=1 Tax=Streptomyces sp. CA-111067 TaxID=3240046 RepID=UPI003D973FA1